MHTCMLALVNPGSLTMVGLQSTTYDTRTTMLALVMPGWLLKAGLLMLTCHQKSAHCTPGAMVHTTKHTLPA